MAPTGFRPSSVSKTSPEIFAEYPWNQIGREVASSPRAVPVDESLEPGFGRTEPAFLHSENGVGAIQPYAIGEGPVLLGRSPQADLRLDRPWISRWHAELFRRGERFFVRDLASQNGTWVNQVRVVGTTEIYPGDIIALGTEKLRLRILEARLLPNTVRRTIPKNPIVAITVATAIGFVLACLGLASWW